MVLGINIDHDSAEKVRAFAASKGLAYRMLLHGDGVAAQKYHCRAFPTLIWIGRDGRVAARDYGIVGPAGLEERARALLGTS